MRFSAFLITLLFMFGGAPAHAASTASYDECQNLAADPFDPRTLGQGMQLKNIEADSAIRVCKKALKKSPNDPLLLYWNIRAGIVRGVGTDKALAELLNNYLALRKIGEHELALFHLKKNDKEDPDCDPSYPDCAFADSLIELAIIRHEKNLRNSYYWCERGFCSGQLSGDLGRININSGGGYLFHYMNLGYYPGILEIAKRGCRYTSAFDRINDDDETITVSIQNHPELWEKALAQAFITKAEINTGENGSLELDTPCGLKIRNLPSILDSIGKYEADLNTMDRFDQVIGALETKVSKTAGDINYEVQLNRIENAIQDGTSIDPKDVEVIASVALSKRPDPRANKVEWLNYSRSRNIYSLMQFNGVTVVQDKTSAIDRWFEAVSDSQVELNLGERTLLHYSQSALLNLISNFDLLSDERKEFVLFEYRHLNINYYSILNSDSVLIYVGHIINQPGFENKLANKYNARARRLLFKHVPGEQTNGVGYTVSANPSKHEKLYEWLHAEKIRRDVLSKAAIVAGIIGGIYVLGSLNLGEPSTSSQANDISTRDDCEGYNGLGWYDDSLGNAAAFFGCSKY